MATESDITTTGGDTTAANQRAGWLRLLSRWPLVALCAVAGWFAAGHWAGTIGSMAVRAGIAEIRYRLDSGARDAGAKRAEAWKEARAKPSQMIAEAAAISSISSVSELRRLYEEVEQLSPPWRSIMAAAIARRWIHLDPESALLTSITKPGAIGGGWPELFCTEWAAPKSDAELSVLVKHLLSDLKQPWQNLISTPESSATHGFATICRQLGPQRVWQIMQQVNEPVPDGFYATLMQQWAEKDPGFDLSSQLDSIPQSARDAAQKGTEQAALSRQFEEMKKVNGEAAASEALAAVTPDQLSRAVASLSRGWGVREPMAAMEWALATFDGENRRQFLETQLSQLADQDVPASFRIWMELRRGGRSGFGYGYYNSEIVKLAAEPARQDELRAAGLGEVAVYWKQVNQLQTGNPELIFKELPDVPINFNSSSSVQPLKSAVIQNWPRSRGWLENLPPETFTHYAQPLLDSVCQADPAAAAAMLPRVSDLPPHLARTVVQNYFSEDNEAAVAWARALPPGDLKDTAMEVVSHQDP